MNAQAPTRIRNIKVSLIPLAVVIGIIVANVFGFTYAVSADLAAILACMVIAGIGLELLGHWGNLESISMRITMIGLFFFVSVLSATYLQRLLWPESVMPHSVWSIPTVLIAFLLTFYVPPTIQSEVDRKSLKLLQEEQRRHDLQRQLLEAKLAALQGQIEPHFLYNTLANVRALIRQDADASEQMLNHLIAYLRAAMPDLRAPTTSLGQELERAEAYLKIMAIRLGERLQFEIEADAAARACLIPPLSVMTLVENAIEHAIEPQVQGGRIRLQAKIVDTQLQILVQDNGQGLKAELGDGVGLLNLQERLAAMYGDAAQLSFASEAEQGLSVSIMIPIEAAQFNTSLGNQLKIAEAENH